MESSDWVYDETTTSFEGKKTVAGRPCHRRKHVHWLHQTLKWKPWIYKNTGLEANRPGIQSFILSPTNCVSLEKLLKITGNLFIGKMGCFLLWWF